MVHRKNGKIVFVSSVAGKVPIPFRSSYAASKHALQAFSDSLRAEVAMYNIKVLVSSPEYIAVDLSDEDIYRAGTPNEGKYRQIQKTAVETPIKIPIAIAIFAVTEKNASPLGDPPQNIAEELFMSVLRDDKEDTPIAFKFAYWLRVTCPAFFHWMMSRRAEQAVIASTQATQPQRFWCVRWRLNNNWI